MTGAALEVAALWFVTGAAVASVGWVALLAREVRATQRARREQRVAEAALEHTRRALAAVTARAQPARSTLPSDPAEVRRVVDQLTGAEVWDDPESAA